VSQHVRPKIIWIYAFRVVQNKRTNAVFERNYKLHMLMYTHMLSQIVETSIISVFKRNIFLYMRPESTIFVELLICGNVAVRSYTR